MSYIKAFTAVGNHTWTVPEGVESVDVLVVAGGGGGVEWVIHNVYHASDVELYISDGTNDIMFDYQNGQGAWLKYAFQLTNGHYLKVKNTNASAQFISFDGVQTK